MSTWRNSIYFIPAMGWAVLIWSLSTTSSLPPIPFDFLSPDKIGHLIFYAIQTILLLWAFYKSDAKQMDASIINTLLAVIIASAYGASLEWVQAGIPGRAFDYADMLANIVGACLGAFLFRVYLRKVLGLMPENSN